MRPSWSTTPTPPASSVGTAAASVDHFGLARPRRDPGRHAVEGRRVARRLRRGVPGTPRDPDPASAAVPLLDVASARRRRRMPRGHPGDAATSRSSANASGTNTNFKAELTRLGFDTGHSETPITPGDDGRPRHGRPFQRPAHRAKASSPSPSCSRRSPSTSRGSARSSRPPTPTSSSTRPSPRSTASATSSASSPGDPAAPRGPPDEHGD